MEDYGPEYQLLLTMLQEIQQTLLMTLVFPDSLSNVYPRTAPLAQHIIKSDSGLIRSIPSTENPLSPISQDTTRVFSVPVDAASGFLSEIQELPNNVQSGVPDVEEDKIHGVPSGWVMKAAKTPGSPAPSTFGVSAGHTWTGFIDLVKVGIIRLYGSLHSGFC